MKGSLLPRPEQVVRIGNPPVSKFQFPFLRMIMGGTSWRKQMKFFKYCSFVVTTIGIVLLCAGRASAQEYDLILQGGHVLDAKNLKQAKRWTNFGVRPPDSGAHQKFPVSVPAK